jgi:hypothetical protein
MIKRNWIKCLLWLSMLLKHSLLLSSIWTKFNKSSRERRRKRKAQVVQLDLTSLNWGRFLPNTKRKCWKRKIELLLLLQPISLGRWIKSLWSLSHRRNFTSHSLTTQQEKPYFSIICKRKGQSFLTTSQSQPSPMWHKDILVVMYILTYIVPLSNQQSCDWTSLDANELRNVNPSSSDQWIHRPLV